MCQGPGTWENNSFFHQAHRVLLTVIAALLVGKWRHREFKEVISLRLDIWWLVIRGKLEFRHYLTPGTAVLPTSQPGF